MSLAHQCERFPQEQTVASVAFRLAPANSVSSRRDVGANRTTCDAAHGARRTSGHTRASSYATAREAHYARTAAARGGSESSYR